MGICFVWNDIKMGTGYGYAVITKLSKRKTRKNNRKLLFFIFSSSMLGLEGSKNDQAIIEGTVSGGQASSLMIDFPRVWAGSSHRMPWVILVIQSQCLYSKHIFTKTLNTVTHLLCSLDSGVVLGVGTWPSVRSVMFLKF